MILIKCENSEILRVKMLLPSDTKFQVEENLAVMPENKILN